MALVCVALMQAFIWYMGKRHAQQENQPIDPATPQFLYGYYLESPREYTVLFYGDQVRVLTLSDEISPSYNVGYVQVPRN